MAIQNESVTRKY